MRACYLEILDKLQKQICRTVGPWLAACVEPSAHCKNVASLSLSYRYYISRCSSELAQLVPPYFLSGILVIRIGCMIFLSPFLTKSYKDVNVKSFFPRTARLWNSLPNEYFPLTYDLNGFKFRNNRHLLPVGSF